MAGRGHKILKDLAVTGLLALVIQLLLGLWSGSGYYPAGETISRSNRIINAHLFHQADALLNLKKIDHYELDGTLYIMNRNTCTVVEPDEVMAGAGIWILWIALVLVFPAGIKSKILVFPVGGFIIYWILALRMSVLVYIASMEGSDIREYNQALIPPFLSIAIPLLWFLLYEVSCKLRIKIPSCRSDLVSGFDYWIDHIENKFDNWFTK